LDGERGLTTRTEAVAASLQTAATAKYGKSSLNVFGDGITSLINLFWTLPEAC
jgi:hypothetical protein